MSGNPKSISPKVKLGELGVEFEDRLKDTIQGFFGSQPNAKDRAELEGHWKVPREVRENVQFLIAFFPDPKHTRLALFFDRGIEAVQQAAQSKGYDFDRAILPWSAEEFPDTGDFFSRILAEQAKAESEKYPGLLIFRESAARLPEPVGAGSGKHLPHPPRPLFVFVVGEKPTAGINKEQFADVLRIIDEIRKGTGKTDPPLLLLGPTSSGSLYSLSEVLHIHSRQLPRNGVLMASGIARSTAAREWFLKNKPDNVRYISFQENETDLLRQFAKFADESLQIDMTEIAVLSEDETSYGGFLGSGGKESPGNVQQAALGAAKCNPAPANDPNSCPENLWLQLQFPRGVSQFRSAYQKEFGFSAPAQEVVIQGRAVLRLDLEARGEDDSVPIFASGQMPLSQEAVMLQIIASLHQSIPAPKFVMLRATDPLDQLFLARYLRTHYPEGRIVVVEPDLLLARDQDELLAGTTTISSYPLVLYQEAVLYHG